MRIGRANPLKKVLSGGLCDNNPEEIAIVQPRVARNELPWVNVQQKSQP